LPWAIRFPLDHHTGGHPVHPTQVYDAALNLLLYLGLAWVFRARRKFDGQIFALYLICYAVTRSLVEIFRGDYSEAHRQSGLTPAQLLSGGILAAGIALFFVLRSRPAAPPAAK
jgi:phosphatidylglycerol:prolipoprotein diacylglycerol transferase